MGYNARFARALAHYKQRRGRIKKTCCTIRQGFLFIDVLYIFTPMMLPLIS